MITPHIIQILGAYAPLTNLVPASQIYPKKAPQDTSLLPNPNYVTVSQILGGSIMTTAGREGTGKATFQVAAYALDTPTAEKIVQRIGECLEGCKGTVNVAGDSVRILGIFEGEDDNEDWLAAIHADEAGKHIAGASFLAWHTEQTT